jgi:hypothetical protein
MGLVMSIILQSTVDGFSAAFMRALPRLESTMIAHGLEPSDFVISKDRSSSVPFFGKFYEYTVFFGEEKFTVTEPNDIRFLDYFCKRCVAADDAEPASPPSPHNDMVHRFLNWMAQPI